MVVRAAAVLALVAALVAWYGDRPAPAGTRGVWWQRRGRRVLRRARDVRARLARAARARRARRRCSSASSRPCSCSRRSSARSPISHTPANFAKLAAATAPAGGSSASSRSRRWVCSSPLIIIPVDIYSVARGPTKEIIENQPRGVRLAVGRSCASRATTRRAAPPQLGLPDVLFFALFLGACAPASGCASADVARAGRCPSARRSRSRSPSTARRPARAAAPLARVRARERRPAVASVRASGPRKRGGDLPTGDKRAHIRHRPCDRAQNAR